LYVGQSGSSLKLRYQEHIRYIKYNHPQSACALRVLQNMHEYEPIQEAMNLLESIRKGLHLNTLEELYLQKYQQNSILIPEQNVGKHNPLFEIAYDLQLQHAGT
jgi:hypothetical protein